ncbi:ABC transporter ATP-binding protein [Feifania hominis]|uniref:ABC transporter ATP-binding protein n=1 Tax=Feifania hominis TaxID=2763660 RepID=A0A926HTN3_9FIRM|nr:ABC transporter ATP-binding protein [Feifania hominis]MBC8536044.1 ABC transporter ATP-binding protein [Feifania hominis]
MLKIRNLHAYYGAIEALKGVDLEVPDGKMCCIIGANGAGKTTLLKSISGMVRHSGEILWNDQDITKAGPGKVNKAGIIHVPEGRLTFPGLTVYQNLEVGTISWHGFISNKKYDKEIEEVFTLFPKLRERRDQMAWSLSGGEQQMLAIGRGLMGRPKLLMLDEPSMGLAPLIVEELFKKIVEINKLGISVLLIEQNARLALKVSDYAYILEQGQIKFHGESQALSNDPRLISAYLGSFKKEERHGVSADQDVLQSAT